MSGRANIITDLGRQKHSPLRSEKELHSHEFASHVFHLHQMEMLLPKKVFENIKGAIEGREKLDIEQIDTIADVLKTWSMKLGATHYAHWFQPLTGTPSVKHNSFLNWGSHGMVIEKFKGKELLRGEPDASSFPSGGLRSTHEARGYTSWDIRSPPFLYETDGVITLYIPSFYFSWKGEPLDYKLPLLRSEEKLATQVLRLLKMAGVDANRLFSTLGIEQEYFLIDRSLFLLRPDLVLAGRTVFGAPPAKGQELEHHYFGPLQERVSRYMAEFEEEAIRLGIPLKTRHNEVAPAQYEVAPLFEMSSLAIDHNLLLMEIMRKVAIRHGLVALFHEKPFAKINGSGKHNNWSLGTDTGLNLLDPKENSPVFLVLLASVLRAVHDHAGLLRASIASLGNDYRLGGSEAPPTILSVYLGEMLEKMIYDIMDEKIPSSHLMRMIDLKLSHALPIEADPSDRNRTSFFAFTGNKFEFRAVGSSAHPALPITVLQAIVADALCLIVDELEEAVSKKTEGLSFYDLALSVVRKHFKMAKPVLFGGNAYTSEWEQEAAIRGLPNIKKSFHSFDQFLEPKSIRAFQGILTQEELSARYEVAVEQYAKMMNIEAHLMLELFRTHILPSALRDQKMRGKSLKVLSDLGISLDPSVLETLKKMASSTGAALHAIDEIEKVLFQMYDLGWEAKAKVFCDLASLKMEAARHCVDRLEALVDDSLWPLPKYWELLTIL
jgi:glutamine synthetase